MVLRGKRLRGRVIDGLNVLLERKGKVIIPRDRLYDWRLNPITEAVYNPIGLSEDAKKYLVPDNPKLLDLKRRYAKCDPDVITPLQWKEDYVRTEDIGYFRGDNAYVWQVHAGHRRGIRPVGLPRINGSPAIKTISLCRRRAVLNLH